MRKVLYVIPYFYDEADDAWPIKYVNDLRCGSGVHDGRVRERPDGTPIDGDIVVEAEEDVHAILRGFEDVTVLSDPA